MTPHPMPPIVLSNEDVMRLAQLAVSADYRRVPESKLLLAEIGRAEILPSSELPYDVVSMNSLVEFVDEQTGTARRVTLVYPRDADIARERVSVLSPVGMALIGLRVGQTIDWPTPMGQRLLLRVAARRPQVTVGRAHDHSNSARQG